MWTAKDFETNKGRWSAIDFGGESQTDPINKLPPQQRDKAEAARRSKMGATKNMTPEPPLAQAPITQPIQQPTQSPYGLPQNVSSAINTSAGLLGGLLKKASPQTSQAVNIAGKLTQPVAEQGVKTVAGGLSAGAEGVVRGFNQMDSLASMGSEGLYGLFGSKLPTVNKEQREKERQASEKLISDIRSDLGVDPNKMSGAGNFVYNTATNIPQMMGGPIPFFLSAAGGYAQDAEQKGANLGQSLAHGLIGGGIEATLESKLGAIPGIKNLKDVAKGGIKGFLKTAAGEALEEAITDPLTKLSEKAIFNKKLPWYSKTEDAVINPNQMGQSALGGGLMATMLAPFGLGGNAQQQQAPIQQMPKRRTDFYTDQYGNTATDINASRKAPQLPLMLPAPKIQSADVSMEATTNDLIKSMLPTFNQTEITAHKDTSQLNASRGIIDTEVSNVKPLNERVAGDNLLDAEDLIDEITSNGGNVDENGYVTLFHKTQKANSDLIHATGKMRAMEDGLFFSTKPDGQIQGYGDTLIELKVPVEKLQIDDVFGDEVHVRIPLKNKNQITDVKEYLVPPLKSGGEKKINTSQGLSNQSFILPNNKYSPNRITPANLAALNRRGLNPEVQRMSDRLSSLNPPIQQKIEPILKPIQQAQQQAAPTVESQKPRQESEILQKRRQAEQLRKEYEQIKAVSKLTPDELTIADNIRKGKLSAVPQGFNTQIINEVANAGRLYDQADGEVKAFNETRKQMLRDTMGNLLEGSDNAKDKSGAFLSREIQERNSIDVFGEETGKKINETIFRPVHDNEAKKTRFINKYVERVKNMNLSKAESQAVQMLGEGKIAEHELPANMDKAKIKNAVAEFRKTYDDLLTLANEILVNNGYAPVEYRKDYFPHFEDPKDPFVKAMKAMGFKVDNITLPTDIAGITHQFRPGKKWFGNFLRREGTNTTYDALEGFERYLYGISDVIYHTNDIQRLRAFETAIRSKYAPDNIKNRIAEIEQSGLSQEEQQAAIDELFSVDKGHLGSYVTDLRAYTDNLAGKKSISDRNMEHKMGRATYNIFDNMNTQVARNMVGFNVSSWLTNFIPLAQAGAGIKTKNFIKAANDTVLNYYKDDGFINKSTFLTNRKGTERLTQTTVQKIADAGMKPMQMIDEFTSQILVRGKYLEGIENGLSHKEAMQKADSYVAGAMADRSKGSMPTAFNTKNPLTKLFTMFQLEVNNQFSFLFKDIPREAKERGGKWLASTLLKFMVGSFLYNELYEKLTGRRPTIDPIGTVKRAVEKGTPLEALQSVGEDILEQTPFVGGIAGGGRLPIGAALPDLMSVVKGDSKLGKEMLKPLTYLVSPFGGGGQAKKTIEGLKALSQGASLSDTGRMRYPIPKTLPNALRTGLFGQYSTPEAREYFDKNRTTLSPNQTQQVMSSEDPQQAYLRIMQQRQINSLNQKIKDVAADDTLTRAEKDKKIEELRQKIIELRN